MSDILKEDESEWGKVIEFCKKEKLCIYCGFQECTCCYMRDPDGADCGNCSYCIVIELPFATLQEAIDTHTRRLQRGWKR